MRDQDYNNTMSALVNSRLDLLHIKLDEIYKELQGFRKAITSFAAVMGALFVFAFLKYIFS
jgi:hypothetical protein